MRLLVATGWGMGRRLVIAATVGDNWLVHTRCFQRNQTAKADSKARLCVSKDYEKNQRFRRISIMLLASIVRTTELGSGTLAIRKPVKLSSFVGAAPLRAEERSGLESL